MAEEMTVVEASRRLFENLEPHVQAHVAKMKTSCSKGCTHCCYLFVTAVLSETMGIAEWVLEQENWKDWTERLVVEARDACKPNISSRDWYVQQRPCVFLDVENKSCRIYDLRPAACRYYYVISPAEDCSIEAGVDRKSLVIDLHEAERHVWKLNEEYSLAIGLDMPGVGPLPMLTLWCMVMVSRDKMMHEKHTFLRHHMEGIPDPVTWIKECSAIIGEERRGNKVPHEELVQIMKKRGVEI